MKLAACIGALVFVLVETSAQNVTINARNLPLKNVCDSIRAQTGHVIFAPQSVFDVASPVTINLINAPIGEALSAILQGQPLNFEISSKTILIFPSAGTGVNSSGSDARIIVDGFVTSVTGEPVEGATITSLDDGASTIADPLGYFRIASKKGAQLQISSIGFQSREITASSAGRINILLDLHRTGLDEATVVAYGTTTRRTGLGATSSVKARELSALPAPNFASLLQGRAAGLDVTQVVGAPAGGGTLLTIRGYNSLDVDQGRSFSNPLWVIDGVPMLSFTSPITGNNLLADINPDFIESIQVLKDASSTSLYGSRAANGVIVIRTKKGRLNMKPEITANISYSHNLVAELPPITIGRAERNLRIAAFKNYPVAYVDFNTNTYRYPTTPEELYLNTNAQGDYFFRRLPYTDNGFYFQDSLNSFFNNATNFFPLYYRSGKVVNANIQNYGGGENMHYGWGAGFFNEDGVVTGSSFNRVDLFSQLQVNISKKLNVLLRMNISRNSRHRADKTVFAIGEGSPVFETVPADPFILSSLLPGENSVVWNMSKQKLSEKLERNRSTRLRSQLQLGWQISPALQFTSIAAADYAVHRRNFFAPSTITDDGLALTSGETGINLLVLNENLLTFTRRIGKSGEMVALAGMSYQFDQEEYNGGTALNSPSNRIYYARPGFPLTGERSVVGINGQITTETTAFQRYLSDLREKSLLSFFGKLEYAYQKKYLFSGTLRRDGSSVFGEHTRWGTFPSLAAGWVLSEERFMKHTSHWLPFAKVRVSWGISGMHFSQNYLAQGVLQVGRYSYQGGGVILPEFNSGLYNEKLTWEETKQFDAGIDLNFINHRISFTADYFTRRTRNMLVPVRLPGTYNGYISQWRNAASVLNRGIEFTANWRVVDRNNLSWSISVNGARIQNRFVHSDYEINFTPDLLTSHARWTPGKPLNGIYGLPTDGFVNKQDDLPFFQNASGIRYYLAKDPSMFYKEGDYRFVDNNGDSMIDSNDEMYLGSALPAAMGGFASELAWNNFSLSILCTYQLGRHIINAVPITAIRTDDLQYLSHPLLADINIIQFWQPGSVNPQYPAIQYDNKSGIYDVRVDRHVEKVNWLKLKALTIRYRLPVPILKKVSAREAYTFISGENLYLFTNYSGIDPETVSINTGIDMGMNYPLPRRFTIGISVNF